MSGLLRLRRPNLTGDAKQRAQAVLLELISEGVTVTRACQEINASMRTVMTWAAEDEAFREQYQLARRHQAHSMADKAVAISQQPVATMVELKQHELEVETLQWFISKTVPRDWGDKVQHDHTVLRGVVVLPALDYSQEPIPAALPPENRVLPSGDP